MRRPGQILLGLALELATLIVAMIMVVIWRLDYRPLVLNEFVPTVEAALSPADGRFSVDIGQLSLALDGYSPILRIEDVQLQSADGRDVLTARQGHMRPLVVALIEDGLFAVKSVTFREVELTIPKAQIVAAFDDTDEGRGDGDNEASAAISLAANAGITARDVVDWIEVDPHFRHLRHVELNRARITVTDEARGLAWQIGDLAFRLERRSDAFIMKGAADLSQVQLSGVPVSRPMGSLQWLAHLPFVPAKPAQGSGETAEAEALLTLDQVSSSVLARSVPSLVSVRGLEAPISGTIATRLGVDEALSALDFALVLASGRISLPGGGALPFTRMEIDGQIRPAARRVDLDRLELTYGGEALAGRSVQLNGYAVRRRDGGYTVAAEVQGLRPTWLAGLTADLATLKGVDAGLAGSIRVDFDSVGDPIQGSLTLTSDSGHIDMPSLFSHPPTFAALAATIVMRGGGREWELQSARLDLADGGHVTLTGSATRGAGGGSAQLRATGTGITIQSLHRLWPLPVSPPSRDWIIENVHSGLVTDLTATLEGAIGQIGSPIAFDDFRADGRMQVEDLELTYWHSLPRATGIRAEVRITEKLLHATISAGESAGMHLTGGELLFTGLDKGKGYELLDLQVEMAGEARALMTILDRDPLNFAQFLELEPAKIGGRVAGRLDVKLPPIAELELDDIEIAARGNLTRLYLPTIVIGQDLSNGHLSLSVDKERLTLDGHATLGGTPADISVDMHFDDRSSFVHRYIVSGRADNAARARFGLDSFPFAPPTVNGTVAFELTATEYRNEGMLLAVDLDASDAALSLEAAAWHKPVGELATGDLLLRIEEGRLSRVESLRLVGPGLKVVGSAEWSANGKGLPTVRLPTLRIGGSTSTALTASPAPQGGYVIDLRGGRIDLRPMLSQVGREPAGLNSEPLRSDTGNDAPLLVRLQDIALQIGDGPAFTDVYGTIQLADGDLRSASFTARAGSAPAMVSVKEDGSLIVSTDDVGAFLASVGADGLVEGGKASLEGWLRHDLSWVRGNLRAEDFVLTNSPTIIRILKYASITGPLQALTEGDGLQMAVFEAPFELQDSRLQLGKGRFYGGSVGITFSGAIEVPTMQLDVTGEVVPIYQFNRAVGAIPLLGDLLTDGAGVFAFSYRASGPYSDPTIDVHPLSPLAPGILRRIFSP